MRTSATQRKACHAGVQLHSDSCQPYSDGSGGYTSAVCGSLFCDRPVSQSLMYADCRCGRPHGEREGSTRCVQKRTRGGGVKNYQIFANALYGRPLRPT